MLQSKQCIFQVTIKPVIHLITWRWPCIKTMIKFFAFQTLVTGYEMQKCPKIFFVVGKIHTRERIMTPIYDNEANLYRKYTSSSRARGWLENIIKSMNGQRCYANTFLYHKLIFRMVVEFLKYSRNFFNEGYNFSDWNFTLNLHDYQIK